MVQNKYQLIVNIKSKGYTGAIPNVTANDNVVFDILVYDGAIPLDLSEVSKLTLVSQRKDNISVIREGTLVNGMVEFVLGSSEMIDSGKVEATVQLYDANNKRVSSAPLVYVVVSDPSLNGSLPADDTTLVVANESLLTQALEASNQILDSSFDTGVLQTKINEKLEDLETQYAPDLNEVKTSLAEMSQQKADTTYVNNAVQNMSAQVQGFFTTLAALNTAFPTGNTNNYVVIADNYIYRWNGSAWASTGLLFNASAIAPGSVTGDKTNFMSLGKNLFNKATAVSGYFVAYDSGNLTANAPYYASDFIPVQPNTTYIRTYGRQMAFYDSNKTYISGINSTYNGANIASPFTFNTPANAAYIRISMNGISELNNEQVELGTAQTSYESYGYRVNQANLSPTSILNLVLSSNSIAQLMLNKNIFNKATATDGSFINWTTGALQANVDYWYSDYIPISPSTSYVQSSESNLAFYDANKVFISGYQKGTGYKTFTTPANAAFIRVSLNPVTSKDTYQLEKGTVSTDYVSYSYTIKNTNNGLPVIVSSSSNTQTTKWSSKNGDALGDSVTQQNKWQPYVISKLGLATFSNHGASGTRISGTDTTAMCNDARINALDVNADFIVAMGGMNDWANSVPLGDINSTDVTTFYGAVKTMIEKLITRYPGKRIILMGTTYGIMPNRVDPATSQAWADTTGLKNLLNLTTGDYAQAMINAARLYGVPCIDLYGNAGWNKINYATYLTNDGNYIHPNDAGGQRIAELLIGRLKSIEPVI